MATATTLRRRKTMKKNQTRRRLWPIGAMTSQSIAAVVAAVVPENKCWRPDSIQRHCFWLLPQSTAMAMSLLVVAHHLAWLTKQNIARSYLLCCLRAVWTTFPFVSACLYKDCRIRAASQSATFQMFRVSISLSLSASCGWLLECLRWCFFKKRAGFSGLSYSLALAVPNDVWRSAKVEDSERRGGDFYSVLPATGHFFFFLVDVTSFLTERK